MAGSSRRRFARARELNGSPRSERTLLGRRGAALVLAIALLGALQATATTPPATASPADQYSGTPFGAGNLPEGCTRDMLDPNNICYHMRTGMNGLDSPEVDVLVMVPVSPTAERDMRIMRQSVEMWDAGIDYLSGEMGLPWLADGMNFHITVEAFDPLGDNGVGFTTYPIVDPEIVIIATNPVGGVGIGIDPVATAGAITGEDQLPCHGVQNPFDFEHWDSLPGFERHDGERGGTYTEDCGGAGGNICFAINAAVDPAPGVVADGAVLGAVPFSIFDLVSHEFGHCLTIGHVGDGAEGSWGALPSNDIMAYSDDPPGINKCVSTLDVEGIAVTMSKYLDVDGDHAFDDQLAANDQDGDGSDAFQVQHPDDHLYASGTGSPMDCPQPDLGLLPGERTAWTPTPVDTSDAELAVTGPQDGTVSNDGAFNVTGTVEHVVVNNDPTEPTGSFDDADDDASTPITEIQSLDVAVTANTVEATISLEDLWPSTALASPTSYSVVIDGKKFDSFVRYAVDANPMTWDGAAYMPPGTSTWDNEANTVTFHIPREHLATTGVVAPYYVGSSANLGLLSNAVVDDSAPEEGSSVGVAGARVIDAGTPAVPLASQAATVTFGHEGGNTFHPEDSSLGVPPFVLDRKTGHNFTLDVDQTSDVGFTLEWTDSVGGTDLDLYVTGAADSGADGATTTNPEAVALAGVSGKLYLQVEPYLVTDALEGSTYTLTATITPSGGGTDEDGDGFLIADDRCPTVPGTAAGCPDGDGDGVADSYDTCPALAGGGADGCPIQPTEFVRVYVDDVLVASQDVDRANGPDSFSIPVDLAEGTHELRAEWEDDGRVLATDTVTVTHNTDDDGDGVVNSADACPGFDDRADADGDGVPDACDPDLDSDGDHVLDDLDNCPDVANADQANMDGDPKGDACDSDMDGDGHSNGKELAQGTDPADASSYPTKAGRTPVKP